VQFENKLEDIADDMMVSDIDTSFVKLEDLKETFSVSPVWKSQW